MFLAQLVLCGLGALRPCPLDGTVLFRDITWLWGPVPVELLRLTNLYGIQGPRVT